MPTHVLFPPDMLPAIESVRPSLYVRVLDTVHSIGVNEMSLEADMEAATTGEAPSP